jgi:5-methylcytosine-specific restriction protein B
MQTDMAGKIGDILASWGASRNVLLYGPPATGKTRLISELFQALNTPPDSRQGILLDPDDADMPFTRPVQEITIPQPVKVVWTTFHQSYGYEDFVLGLRPEITADGTRLQPWAGVLLDAALELADTSSEYKSVVIFIDEVNRGNAARVFGEFMTFLDFDYREGGRVPLPLPLRQLTYEDGRSEKIYRPGGKATEISQDFTFPKHVYIVSTMNSVDRAAVPIDSALARRFDRIEMRPSLEVLAQHWGMDKAAISALTDSNWETLSPFETGYLILDRLNVAIASYLGPEFELGHGLLMPILATKTEADGTTQAVEENVAWSSLAKTWDDVLFPQLEDRYSGRPEQMIDLLHADSPPSVGTYAWTLRTAMGGTVAARTLTPVRVSELDIDIIKRSFRWLTR